MNFFESLSNGSIDRVKAAFESKDISQKTQNHLSQVYFNLMACTAICTLGMYLNAATFLSGWVMTIVTIIGMAYMMYKITNIYEDEKTRMGYLWALSFCMGYLVGPVMHYLG